MPHLFKSFPVSNVLFTSQWPGQFLTKVIQEKGKAVCPWNLLTEPELFCYMSATKHQLTFTFLHNQSSRLIPAQNSLTFLLITQKNYPQDGKMTNSDDEQKTEIAVRLSSGEGEEIWFVGMGREHDLQRKKSACSWKRCLKSIQQKRADRSPSLGDMRGVTWTPDESGKGHWWAAGQCPAELMPCAGYDTYIKPWKGEEGCCHISESPWTRREAGLLLKRVPVDDNQTRERFSWCTLLIPIPPSQGKSHPDPYPPSLAIITSIGPDFSGAKEDRLK